MSSTKSRIEVDVMVEAGGWPAEPQLRDLVDRAIASLEAAGVLGAGTTELSVVFSDDRRVRELNAAWRGKDRPTNVLSFPAFATPGRGAGR